jgi:6-phosphogluconolactonase/glucosamine-6-phosphate isomerase/deaminase
LVAAIVIPMQCILVDGPAEGITDLAERLNKELDEGKTVAWLVCGGSNIPAAVEVMNQLRHDVADRLTITLTDERFGEPGHADSNWQQLKQAGFDFAKATAIPVLEADTDLTETTKHYHAVAEEILASHDVIIAQFGIGADGHIAGILPGSPASQEQEMLAAGYSAGQFTRLTLTFPALQQIDAAYAMAFGGAKKTALSQLQSQDIVLQKQPSQILKKLPEAYVYNDQIGDNS